MQLIDAMQKMDLINIMHVYLARDSTVAYIIIVCRQTIPV